MRVAHKRLPAFRGEVLLAVLGMGQNRCGGDEHVGAEIADGELGEARPGMRVLILGDEGAIVEAGIAEFGRVLAAEVVVIELVVVDDVGAGEMKAAEVPPRGAGHDAKDDQEGVAHAPAARILVGEPIPEQQESAGGGQGGLALHHAEIVKVQPEMEHERILLAAQGGRWWVGEAVLRLA